MSNMGSNTKSLDSNYSTLNERGDHNRTLDRSGDLGEMEPLKGTPLMPDEGQESLEEELDMLVLDEEGDQVSYSPMVCPPATPKIIIEEGGPCVPAVCQSR